MHRVAFHQSRPTGTKYSVDTLLKDVCREPPPKPRSRATPRSAYASRSLAARRRGDRARLQRRGDRGAGMRLLAKARPRSRPSKQPRPDTTAEALAKLRPIVKAGGLVTAGNASGAQRRSRRVDPGLAVRRRVPPAAAWGARSGRGQRRRAAAHHGHLGLVPATRRLCQRFWYERFPISTRHRNQRTFAVQVRARAQRVRTAAGGCPYQRQWRRHRSRAPARHVGSAERP